MSECDICGGDFESERAVKIHKSQTHTSGRDYHDPEKLEEMYIDEDMSMQKIADEFGICRSAVGRVLKRYGLTGHKEDPIGRRVERAHYYVDSRGYERVQSSVGDTTRNVRVHRLVAVAEYGLEAVVDSVVHHKNGVPWDNRPENLEPMSNSDHTAMHNRQTSNS